MTSQNEAWPFREPVKAEEVPDYYTLVKVSDNAACVFVSMSRSVIDAAASRA